MHNRPPGYVIITLIVIAAALLAILANLYVNHGRFIEQTPTVMIAPLVTHIPVSATPHP